jgi:hypothetical protein
MDTPILDDGQAYTSVERQGMAYGWDCGGELTFPEIPAVCVIYKSDAPVADLPADTCTGADAAACEAGSVGWGDDNDGFIECRWTEASQVAGQPVDYSRGIRAPPREIYGMTYFDRFGACVGRPVNFQVAVPSGYYSVSVDFAADSTGQERRDAGNDGGWANCKNDHLGESAVNFLQVEGRIACYHRPGCIYNEVVPVTDGKLTITGYSHNSNSCHALAFVKFAPAPPPPPAVPSRLAAFTARQEVSNSEQLSANIARAECI